MRDHNHDVASSYCPSQDWDRYCASQDMPEQCPECGEENCTEDGEPVCPTHPAFCSVKCADVWAEREFQAANNEAAEYLAEVEAIKAHNAKCPQCKGSERYCFCPTNPDNKED